VLRRAVLAHTCCVTSFRFTESVIVLHVLLAWQCPSLSVSALPPFTISNKLAWFWTTMVSVCHCRLCIYWKCDRELPGLIILAEDHNRESGLSPWHSCSWYLWHQWSCYLLIYFWHSFLNKHLTSYDLCHLWHCRKISTFKWTRCSNYLQVYCLSFKYSSTCFGHPLAYHQGPINCSSSLWFYRWSVVVAVLLVVVGPAGPKHVELYLNDKQ
jgi:hypothetical protein